VDGDPVIAATVVFAAVAALALALLARARVQRRRLAVRLDAVSSTLAGDVVIASPTPELATDRLERLAARPAAVEAGRRQPSDSDQYRTALDTITLGVVIIDLDGRIRYRNPFAATFLDGRHGAAVVGHVIDELAATALDADGGEREVQLYGPPRRKLFVSASPILTATGREGAVVMIDDITEQERLDAIRRDFVANISHELRTPIGAMSLLAETLVGESDPEIVESLSGRLSLEANRLGRTIEDLLQLSRIEHGSDDDFVPVVIQSVIATAHDRVRAAADQRDVEIGVACPTRDLVVRGDERQLSSAVFNLLDNAVKYIGEGGGNVSVRTREVDEQVEIPDLRALLPGRPQAGAPDSGGTGLGLAIVRHVIANHGGRIEVESTEGEGTTFTMFLPAADGTRRDDPDRQDSYPPPPDDGNDHEVTRP
jgi:two-component system, OmpR family, sensor histidine kinase SenX3